MDTTSPTRSARRRKSIGARGVVLAAVTIAMLFSSVYPLGRYVSLKREITALRAEEARLDQTLEMLQQERATLLTDAEVERLARERLGYVRPGERPFAIAEPRAADAPEPLVPVIDDPEPAANDSMFERWWHALTNVARAS